MLAKLMVLHHQILFSLAIAAITEAILMQISAEQVPSLHRVASRYLKLVASSNFWLLLLLIMILLFSDFHSIYAIALSISLLVKS